MSGKNSNNFSFIGVFIRAYRQANSLSLQMLADKSDVSRSMIAQIESQKTSPTLAVLQKLADAMEIELRDLVQSPESSHTLSVNTLMKDNIVSKPDSPFVCHLLRKHQSHTSTEIHHFYFRFSGKTSFGANVKGSIKSIWLESGTLILHLSATKKTIRARELVTFHANVPHRFESTLERGLARGNFFIVL
jgi:transcriptional regulator with XRE-family HTH domain